MLITVLQILILFCFFFHPPKLQVSLELALGNEEILLKVRCPLPTAQADLLLSAEWVPFHTGQ